MKSKTKSVIATLIMSASLCSCGLIQKNNYDSEVGHIYKLYKQNGCTMSYDDWLETIKGEAGESAFEMYKRIYGYSGTEQQWLDDLANGNLGNQTEYTVSFVTNWDVQIPSIQVKKGNVINKSDIQLPTGYVFESKFGSAYYVDTQTFSGDFNDYEPWSFIGYGVYGNMTLALDIYEKNPTISPTNEEIVNLYGRNLIENDKVTLYASGSGFEVSFKGTELKGNFVRERSVSEEASSTITTMKLRVYVDGDRELNNSNLVILSSETDNQDITLVSGLSNGEHTVLVRKASYEDRGAIVVNSLKGPERFYKAPNKPNKRVLIYGDSLTVGYAVNYKVDDGQKADTWEAEDGTKSYSTLLTDYFGVEYQQMCVSGISLGVPSWREFTWYQRWNKYSYFSNVDYPQDKLNGYDPDLIIINLGTNDTTGFSGTGTPYGKGTAGEEAYKIRDNEPAGYSMWTTGTYFMLLVKKLRQVYPNAKIIGATGMTSANNEVFSMYNYYLNNILTPEGYTDVYTFQFNHVETSPTS